MEGGTAALCLHVGSRGQCARVPWSKHRSLKDSKGASESWLRSCQLVIGADSPGKAVSEGGTERMVDYGGNCRRRGVSTGNIPAPLHQPGLLSGQSRRASRKEIKGNHPHSLSLVRLTARMPACVPWAMFMLCPARDRIDSPTQHCALIQNLSRSGKPESQSHSLSLLRIRPYGLWKHSPGCINRTKIASRRPAEINVHPLL